MPSRNRHLSKPIDARDALAVVQHVYACAMAPGESLWDTVLGDLADVLVVDAAGASALDKATGRVTVLGLIGFDTAKVESAFRRFGVEADPLFLAVTRQPVNATFVDGAVLSPEDAQRSPYYDMLAAREHIEHHLAGVVRNDAQAAVMVALWRRAESKPFSEAERQTLQWLMPHLAQAAEIRERVATGGARSWTAPPSAATAWLDEPRRGVLVLDADGQVLLANAEAGRIAAAGESVQLVRNRLTAADPALRQELEQARLATLRGNGGSAWPILRASRPAGGLPVEIQLLPVDGRDGHDLLPPGAATIALLTDPGRVLRLSPARLQALGLTTAEARLCEALLHGGSLRRAATELGIAHGTARSHLKSVFAKLGVGTQIELVQVLVAGFGGD